MLDFNFAEKQVRRMARNRIISFLLLIAIACAVLFLNTPSFFNLYLRNSEFTYAEELDAHYSSRRQFAETTADYLFYSEYVYSIDNVDKF